MPERGYALPCQHTGNLFTGRIPEPIKQPSLFPDARLPPYLPQNSQETPSSRPPQEYRTGHLYEKHFPPIQQTLAEIFKK